MEEKKRPSLSEIKAILTQFESPGVCDSSVKAFVSEEGGNEYLVWLVDNGCTKYVLKQAKAYEIDAYRCFFSDRQPYIPSFFGACHYNGQEYFITEFFAGTDLRVCDRKRLTLVLDALAEMQNEF